MLEPAGDGAGAAKRVGMRRRTRRGVTAAVGMAAVVGTHSLSWYLANGASVSLVAFASDSASLFATRQVVA
jgi:hypothetical protein